MLANLVSVKVVPMGDPPKMVMSFIFGIDVRGYKALVIPDISSMVMEPRIAHSIKRLIVVGVNLAVDVFQVVLPTLIQDSAPLRVKDVLQQVVVY